MERWASCALAHLNSRNMPQMGDDRVYDVIQELLEDVPLVKPRREIH